MPIHYSVCPCFLKPPQHPLPDGFQGKAKGLPARFSALKGPRLYYLKAMGLVSRIAGVFFLLSEYIFDKAFAGFLELFLCIGRGLRTG